MPTPPSPGGVTTATIVSCSTTLPLVILSAAWGGMVDWNIIPMLSPTGSSTIFQSTTAGSFAAVGILFGPLAGGLCGLCRDGTSYVVTFMLHPGMIGQPGFTVWLLRGVTDTLEDVVLGLVPGLIALRTRRLLPLLGTTAATTWLSLPMLVIANRLAPWHPEQVWSALATAVGDWDEPVDPGLTVYALLAGAVTAL